MLSWLERVESLDRLDSRAHFYRQRISKRDPGGQDRARSPRPVTSYTIRAVEITDCDVRRLDLDSPVAL